MNKACKALVILLTSISALAAYSTPAYALFEIHELEARTQTLGADWASSLQGMAAAGNAQRTATNLDDNPDTIPQLNNAGGHGFLNFSVAFNGKDGSTNGGLDAVAKRIEINLPPGLVGNPLAAGRCPIGVYEKLSSTSQQCPADSQIGYVGIAATGTSIGPVFPTPIGRQDAIGYIFNLEPKSSNEVARLGAIIDLSTNVIAPSLSFQRIKVPIIVSVRTGSDYSITNTQDNIPQRIGQYPEASSSYPASVSRIDFTIYSKTPANNATHVPLGGAKPFLTNPTSCAPKEFSVSATNYKGESDSATFPYQATNCGSVPFTPTMDVANDNQEAGKPSSYTFDIAYPNYDVNANVYESNLKKAVVALPDGVTLSAAAAAQLDACSDEKMGFGNEAPPQCPAASDIGDVSVTSPVIDSDLSDPDLDPIGGQVFFGKPLANDRWRIFTYIEGLGLRIKLKGSAQIDEATGKVTTTFDNLPEVPFTNFQLKLRGGDNGILSNPESCGTQEASIDLYPHSGGSPVRVEPTVTTNSNCPPVSKPFNPTATASVDPPVAGADSRLSLKLERPDSDQLLDKLDISLPAGLIGGLNGIELCDSASAAVGSCSNASRIGSVRAEVGTSDGSSVSFPGSIHLAQPLLAGDPASLSVSIPARVGPIDLGNVVNQTRIALRPGDKGLDNLTATLPRIFAGIPLKIRSIDVSIDKQGFLRNPTGCDARQFAIKFSAVGGASSTTTAPFQAIGCDAIPFSPNLRMIAGGKNMTKVGQGTNLRAIVTQSDDEAANAGAVVTLPEALRPNLPAIQKLICSGDQFVAGTCPAFKQVGTATVRTPLLPEPLSGPVFIGQRPGEILPDLDVQLYGSNVGIRLAATNKIAGVRTVNTFAGLPDVPISEFNLSLSGGTNGIIKNFRDLCQTRGRQRADSTFTGQNGKTFSDRPVLEVDGCPDTRGLVSLSGKRVRVSKRGVAKIRIGCPGPDQCRGKVALRTKRSLGSRTFKIDADQSKSIAVKLSRKALRTLKKRKGQRVSIVATIGKKKTTRKIQLLAPKR